MSPLEGNKMRKNILNSVKISYLYILIFAIILCISFSKNSEANTIVVTNDGSGDYSIIQNAIDNATDKDIIRVYSGIYYENI